MFKRIAAVATVAALTILGGATAAFAAPMPGPHYYPHGVYTGHRPFGHGGFDTQFVTDAYSSSDDFGYALNNYNGQGNDNNLVSVFNDLGQGRTHFSVRQVDTYNGDEVITVETSHKQFLSDWDNVTPAREGFRGRFVYQPNNVPGDSAKWVVVPSAQNGEYELVNLSTEGLSTPALALTVAEGGGTTETTGNPAWSDTVLLPANLDAAQLWSFTLPGQHHNHPVVSGDVTATQSGTNVTNANVLDDGVDYSYVVTNADANSASVSGHVTEKVTLTVTGGSYPGTYVLFLEQNVTAQTVAASSTSTLTNDVTVGSPGTVHVVSQPSGANVTDVASLESALAGSTVTATVVETPYLSALVNGSHEFVSVTPSTQSNSF